MAYNRRNSRSRTSHEDAHLTSPTTPTTSGLPALAPPRPFFLQRSAGDRGSYSSADTLDTGSDSDAAPPVASPTSPSSRAAAAGAPQIRQRNHKRRSQQQQPAAQQPGGYAPVESGSRDPFATPGEEPWSPASLYEGGPGSADSHTPAGSVRGPGASSRQAPPSSFAFGYQAEAAPSHSRPAVISRRSSVESIRRPPSVGAEYAAYPPNSPVIGGGGAGGYGALATGSPSATDLSHGLDRPNAPFMGPSGDLSDHSRRSSFHSAIHETSAAGAMQTLEGRGGVPRVASVTSFRAPFLSPASRPGSTFWTPPAFPYGSTLGGSGSAVGLAKKAPMPSTRIAAKLTKEEKPWIGQKDTPGRVSWWLTVLMMFAGIAVGALIIYQGYTSQQVFRGAVCPVMEDDYRNINGLDSNTWNREVGLGGWGNGEFEAMSNNDANLFFDHEGMHLRPTLVADDDHGGDWSPIFDGGSIDLGDACTVGNKTACSVQSANNKTILPPAYSARINTKGLKSIKFGRVEVKARLPVGDWLWPAIWMLPEGDAYGGWPLSGEIDLMEARGNAPAYPNGGNNVIRSTLNYGPLPGLIKSLFGWQEFKRTSLAADFHTYALEWDEDAMRFYIDSRLHSMLALSTFKGGFFKRAGFPTTAHNGTDTEVVVQDPWTHSPNVSVPAAAPYDQPFYMIIDLAVGGTSGWFPDAVGGKPWYDNSGASAMLDFAAGYETWTKTWPSDSKRDFVIQSVKMYQLKKYGGC